VPHQLNEIGGRARWPYTREDVMTTKETLMRISAVLRPFSAREVRAKLVQYIALTVHLFALLRFVFSQSARSKCGRSRATSRRYSNHTKIVGRHHFLPISHFAARIRNEIGQSFGDTGQESQSLCCGFVPS
jgi:hypothetical protein